MFIIENQEKILLMFKQINNNRTSIKSRQYFNDDEFDYIINFMCQEDPE